MAKRPNPKAGTGSGKVKDPRASSRFGSGEGDAEEEHRPSRLATAKDRTAWTTCCICGAALEADRSYVCREHEQEGLERALGLLTRARFLSMLEHMG